jgi:hypothetical protein
MAASKSEIIRRLMRQIRGTQGGELGCEEVYALLDQFAEAAAAGRDPGELLPLVAQHLELCPDCREEYEALMRVLQARR